MKATEWIERVHREKNDLDRKSLEQVVRENLDEIESSEPPLETIPENIWESVSREMSEYLAEEKSWENLDLMEKQAAKLMLSGDQKRVRPVIGTLLLEAAGTETDLEENIRAATSAEGVHFYSKGIDDIEDGDIERNGEIALHAFMAVIEGDVQEGIGKAVNYYLGSKTRNYRPITNLDEEIVSFEQKEELRKALEEKELELVDGQNMDLDGEDIGKRREMIPDYLGGDFDVLPYITGSGRQKTGALFSYIGRLPEILGDIKEDTAAQWGYLAGEAFQIQDDVLDLKNERYSDIRDNNYTVPIFFAEQYLHTHEDNEKQVLGGELSSLLRKENNSKEELQRAHQIIEEETPALERSEKLAAYKAEKAKEYLEEPDWDEESYANIIKDFTQKFTYDREK